MFKQAARIVFVLASSAIVSASLASPASAAPTPVCHHLIDPTDATYYQCTVYGTDYEDTVSVHTYGASTYNPGGAGAGNGYCDTNTVGDYNDPYCVQAQANVNPTRNANRVDPTVCLGRFYYNYYCPVL